MDVHPISPTTEIFCEIFYGIEWHGMFIQEIGHRNCIGKTQMPKDRVQQHFWAKPSSIGSKNFV
jgi:hypothetical protein